MARVITYWTSTVVVALVLFTGGIADLAMRPETAEGVLALGYPLLFLTILGTWKVLGAVALMAPRFPRVKEWAYAGAFFNFSGAVVSHIAAGSASFHVVVTGLLTVITLASWALRPESRILGALAIRGTVPAPAESAGPAI